MESGFRTARASLGPRTLLPARGFLHRPLATGTRPRVITHAHGGSSSPRQREYILARPGTAIAQQRLGSGQPSARGLWGPGFGWRTTVSLHPAGHILGSAQVRIEHAGRLGRLRRLQAPAGPDLRALRAARMRCVHQRGDLRPAGLSLAATPRSGRGDLPVVACEPRERHRFGCSATRWGSRSGCWPSCAPLRTSRCICMARWIADRCLSRRRIEMRPDLTRRHGEENGLPRRPDHGAAERCRQRPGCDASAITPAGSARDGCGFEVTVGGAVRPGIRDLRPRGLARPIDTCRASGPNKSCSPTATPTPSRAT